MNFELSEAVRTYLGFGTASWPQADTDAIAHRFVDQADQVSGQIAALLTEAEQFRPNWDEVDLAAATQLAEAHMRKFRPELTDEAIKAIAWAWSYWNR
jgi:hypothetical protein